MYNYFLDQKLKQERKNKEKENRRLKEQNDYRKILNDQLVDKYNDRVYNYILDLAQNQNKIVKLQDATKKIDNCRIEYLKETYDDNSIGMGFSFGGFITDKERISRLLEERKKDNEKYELYLKEREERQRRNQIEKITKKFQRSMRFKPKNELERIIELFGNYNPKDKNKGKNEKEDKKNKKKKLKKSKTNGSLYGGDVSRSLCNSQEESEKSDEDEEEEESEEDKEKNFKVQIKSKKQQIAENFYNKELERLKKIQKSKAKLKQLIRSNTQKTFWKGAFHNTYSKHFIGNADQEMNTVSLFNFGDLLKLGNVDHKKKRVRFENKDIYKKEEPKKFGYTQQGFHRSGSAPKIGIVPLKEKKEHFKFINSELDKNMLSYCTHKFPVVKENFDLVKNNPLIYNLSSGVKEAENPNFAFDEDKREYLKKLCSIRPMHMTLGRYEKYVKKLAQSAKKSGVLFGKNLLKDEEEKKYSGAKLENVLIDGQVISINKKKVIINKMLKKLNFVHEKSKFSNKSLYQGEGKLSMTSGMTINNFEEKYGFK